jgi:manganese/zinc/iron transport system permease protein
MTLHQVEIQLIALVVSIACSLMGVFLVLRSMALMSDAISHAILIGIVLAFFLVKNLSSPLLIIAAALTGVVTVSIVEIIKRTGLVKEDAAIGIVFPVLFSLGVILISRFAGDIHLDTDVVLLGELAFAPFNRLVIAGYDIGPKALHVMLVILAIDILFVAIHYKELKIGTFDPGLAASLGISIVFLNYAFMTMVSITVVGAFDAVGSILVVALMIAPPASAYLICDRLGPMVFLSVVYGAVSALGGYWLARSIDASIAGSMATMTGILFILTFLLAPYRGMISLVRRRIKRKWEFAQAMLAVHLLHHEDQPDAAYEMSVVHLHEHLKWEKKHADKVLHLAVRRGLMTRDNKVLLLTEKGRAVARKALVL